jgi:short subunit fatty acids transporter
MKNKNVIIAVVVVLLLVVGYMVMNAPDQRSTGEQIGDAVGKLDEGVDDAARELEDRTPAERISDDIKDATDGSPE